MFHNPLGLFALLAVPAVLALHLFRRRFRPRPVSAIFLWQAEDRTSLAGRKREPLRSSASLWCELFAALALSLALAGPRACGAGEADHLVVVLDDSASMSAVGAAESAAVGAAESAAARARALVRERMDALAARSRVTLIASGSPPVLLAGPAAFPEEAQAALDAWDPSRGRHDLSPAVALGLQLAGDGSVLLVTDRHEPDRYPPEVALAALGTPLDNVAITHAARARVRGDEPGEVVERVFLTVSAFTTEPVRARVALGAPGDLLHERELVLEPGGREHLSFELPEGAPTIEARIEADALVIDDRATLAPVPPRTVALYSTLPPSLEAFLGVRSGVDSPGRVDRWLAIVPDSIDAGSPDAAHLVLCSAPPAAAGAGGRSRPWALALEAQGAERADLIGPFLAERRHPLLEGVTLQGIVWSAEPDRALPGAPLVSAGDLPLLTEEHAGGRTLWHVNIDPLRSSLQRSPEWPILLGNAAEARRRELPGPESANVAVGERFTYRGDGDTTYVLAGEGTERAIRAREALVIDGIARPGRYELRANGEPLCAIGVSFCDAAESDLRVLGAGERESNRAFSAIRSGLGRLEMALLLAALALVVLDWIVLGRAAPVEA